MRIPIYGPQQNISAPQLNTPQVAAPIDLSSTIKAVEDQYEIGQRQKQEDEKLFFANETTRTEFELQTKYAEALDRIDQGDYGAQKEFEKFYNETVNKSIGRLSYNQTYQTQAQIDYKRFGLESGLKLKDAVRSKTRESAVSAAAQSEEIYGQQYLQAKTFEEKQEILKKNNSMYARLESLGAIKKGSGNLASQKFVNNVISLEANLILQDEDPKVALAFIERNQSNLSPENYVRLRGTALAEIERFDDLGKAQKQFSDFLSGKSYSEPTQQQVSIVYDNFVSSLENQSEYSPIENPDGSIQEPLALQFIKQTSFVPDKIKNEVNSILLIGTDEITEAQALSIANVANIVTEAIKNPAIKNRDKSFGKESVAVAQSITSKIASGLDTFTAVKQVMRAQTNPDFASIYDKAYKSGLEFASQDVSQIASDLDRGVFNSMGFGDLASGFYPSLISDYADKFAMLKSSGTPDDQAKIKAKEDLATTYDTFNEVFVKNPPHILFPNYTRDSLEKAFQSQTIPGVAEGEKAVLMADRQTFNQIEKMKAEGSADITKTTFPVIRYLGDNIFIPARNPETGKEIRFRYSVNAKLKIKNSPLYKQNVFMLMD